MAVPAGALLHRSVGIFEVQYPSISSTSGIALSSRRHSSHLLPFKMAFKENILTRLEFCVLLKIKKKVKHPPSQKKPTKQQNHCKFWTF